MAVCEEVVRTPAMDLDGNLILQHSRRDLSPVVVGEVEMVGVGVRRGRLGKHEGRLRSVDLCENGEVEIRCA